MSILHRFCLPFILTTLTLAAAASSFAQEVDPPSRPIALVGGTVLSAPEAEPLVDAVVVIEDARIVAVGPKDSVEIPEGTSILSIDGHYVTAGFWNTHVHFNGFLGRADTLSDSALAEALEMALLRWGFVRVLEPHTSDLVNTREIQRRIADGSVPGPSILTTGSAFDPAGGNHLGLQLPEIRTPDEAQAGVKDRIEQGVDAIKIMTGSVTPDSIVTMPVDVARAAVEVAHSEALPVFAHPSNEEGARVAIEAGVDAFAHVFASGVSEEWDRSLIDRMVREGIALTPTLIVFEISEVARSQLQRFRERGGEVLFGTDLRRVTGTPDPTSEYWLMARAGMDSRQILGSLTTAPARFFGLEDEVGRIEAGLIADLVVLAGNPLEEPEQFARVRYSIREGEIVYDGDSWDPDSWERLTGRPYISIVRGIPTVSPSRWGLKEVDLSPEALRAYEGTYQWERERIRVWVEDSLLWITPLPGLEVTHLIPVGEDEFLQGLYRDGRPVEIYQPRTEIRFVVEEGEGVAMTLTEGNWSSGRIERVE